MGNTAHATKAGIYLEGRQHRNFPTFWGWISESVQRKYYNMSDSSHRPSLPPQEPVTVNPALIQCKGYNNYYLPLGIWMLSSWKKSEEKSSKINGT